MTGEVWELGMTEIKDGDSVFYLGDVVSNNKNPMGS